MASLHTSPNGTRRILFIGCDGRRRGVRLGKLKAKLANEHKQKIEELLQHQRARTPLDAALSDWLGKIDDVLHKRLCKAGLATARLQKQGLTYLGLAQFIDNYIEIRADIKPGTKTNYLQTRRWLIEFFGEEKPLASITQGDAEELRSFLSQRLDENTLRRHLKRAGQFFRHAVRKQIIRENPFGEMKALSSRGNRDKFHFITKEQAQAVLDACPDSQWRILFALSRWGGLRCPSEHLGLKWTDVDWKQSRMTVRSPKTERHEGKASRVIPLFPELRQELADAFEPEDVYIITKYREPNVNLRTQFMRIIARAGLQPWPKLFHNLRATRQTELAQEYPAHVVSDWLGNSIAVASEHYLRTMDSDFERASGKAAQNAAQFTTVSTRMGQNEKWPHFSQSGAIPELASPCTSVQDNSMTLGRVEQSAILRGNSVIPTIGGAESGALSDQPAPLDPELAKLIDSWPSLAVALKRAILAIVDAG